MLAHVDAFHIINFVVWGLKELVILYRSPLRVRMASKVCRGRKPHL